MGLKDRFNGDLLAGGDAADEREAAGRESGASYGIGYFKRKLLEEIDLAEMSSSGHRSGAPAWSASSATSSAARARSCRPRERGALIRRVVDEALGLGVLEPLLADESITEIMVNGPDDVFVERAGRARSASPRASPPRTS